ncbi:epoxide hydrolase family protein [Streptoalloteichus hindustanus]|uniref:Pimeloyl-ACP methyl ester carboxylesterase n=1 Tax=Streptoalloteichus hindustanus TaxID=2017 RepID=A0A1M5I6L9_STRHI|nr:epoxide hydrolase family protein [Streptoalloteichus hindustanus]SHG23998.1 Pimeloyl-ACP methyl ester carboxylesterase [Streptoalloteichus hindustanus]
MTEIRRFEIAVPQADLDDLADRLARTRWTDPAPGADDNAYGVGLDEVRRLAEYWRAGYDWRKWEARLNQYPQFVTEIDGQDIHFLHVRSPEPDAFPLVLTHGWPGSVVEFLDLIGPLTDPAAHGGDPADAFHLVIPSLPGFGFGGPTTDTGWGTARIARAWAELMRRLGYERYGAHGNDGGSLVSPELGRVDSEHVAGVHVTQIFSFPSGDPAEFAGLSEEDMAALQVLQWFYENKFSFNQLHSQQPQTLAHALADSPVGLLGWNAQLFASDAEGSRPVDDDFILTNVAIYWFTRTAGSSIRFYYENAKAQGQAPSEPTTVPIGLASFNGDFRSIRRFAERDHKNITQWHTYEEHGGHYAAHLEPELMITDLRGFFRGLR